MPFRIPVFVLFVFALFATVSPQSVNFDDDPLRCLEDDEILTDVLKTYDKLFSPEQKPLKTSVAVWIEDIVELNQEKSGLQMSIYVTAQWLDQRLAFNNLNPCRENITIPDATMIWTPDLGFIDNQIEQTLHSLPTINSFASVDISGQIRLHQRVAVRSPCTFDLQRYPFDSVRCKLTLASFRMNNERVHLSWRENGLMVDIKEDKLDGFKIGNISASKNIVKYPADAGYWTELNIGIRLTRNWLFLWHSYIPAVLCVFAAGITFFLGRKSTIARAVLAGFALVALIFLIKSTSVSLDGAIYFKTFDYYMIACALFVSFALVELAIANSCPARASYDMQKSSDGFEQLVSYSSNRSGGGCCNRNCGKFDVSVGFVYALCFLGWNVFYFLFFMVA